MDLQDSTLITGIPEGAYSATAGTSRTDSYLKRGVWIYFLLLIFEGALRKWVLPQFSEPLLLVRDPLAIWLIYKAWQQGYWRPNAYVLIIWAASIVALSLALLVGHSNIPVALYGLRITLVQFPLLFIIGRMFRRQDVLRMGEVLVWLNIGMTILVAVQFFSPQDALVNRAIGGDLDGSGFSGARGFFRVPGTFSFTNGLAFFYGLTAAFLFYFWIAKYKDKRFRILLTLSTLALLAAVPLSISRTVLFQIVLTFSFVMVVAMRNKNILKKTLVALTSVGLLVMLLKDTPSIQIAKEAFTERLISANEIEGGMEGVILDRFLGGMYGAITDESYPFWGLGLGMGSNAGARMLTGETRDGVFLISEGEWGRLVGEMGLILGFTVILVRISLVASFFRKAWKAGNQGNVLPWMLLSFGSIILIQGNWAHPTTLGFAVLTGGLILASLREE